MNKFKLAILVKYGLSYLEKNIDNKTKSLEKDKIRF